MSKSKRFKSPKKPLKVGFSLQKRTSHQGMGKIKNYEEQTSIPGPSFMHEGYCPRRCTSLLAPRSLRADGEFERIASESEQFPEISEQSQVKPSEASCKATEKSKKSFFIQRGSSSWYPGFVSSKCTSSSITRSHSASSRKSGQFSEPSKNTYQSDIKRTKTPCKATLKTAKASEPKCSNDSRKLLPSLATRSRIIGGGSKAPSPPSESSSKFRDQSIAKLTKMLCKAAGKPVSKLENSTKSVHALKSSCSDARSPRRGSCVSFHEPVAAEIPYCDPPSENGPCSGPDHPIAQKKTPKSVCKKCSCPKTDHPTPVTTCEQKPLKKRSPHVNPFGKYKRPIIVVPLGMGSQRDHKERSCPSSLQNPARSSNFEHTYSSSNTKLKSYIPYSRSSFHHVDSLSNLHVSRSVCQQHDPSPSVCQHRDPSPSACQHHDNSPSVRQCDTKSTSCTNCTVVSHQIRELVQKINCLEATVLKISEKREKAECPKLERKLSTCEFCRGRNLPILDSFKRQLKEAIGCRCNTEVVISIFLRADNIYHVNVRDLKSRSSLACFLVTDDAIMEVQQLGLFREILTFCVIDVRNTLKPKNCALGITFELVDPERQKGGSNSVNPGLCLTCRPFLASVLGQPLHRLRHVYTDPAITANYVKKSLKEKFSRNSART